MSHTPRILSLRATCYITLHQCVSSHIDYQKDIVGTMIPIRASEGKLGWILLKFCLRTLVLQQGVLLVSPIHQGWYLGLFVGSVPVYCKNKIVNLTTLVCYFSCRCTVKYISHASLLPIIVINSYVRGVCQECRSNDKSCKPLIWIVNHFNGKPPHNRQPVITSVTSE